MIVLLFEAGGAGFTDELLISATCVVPAQTVQWYCSWYNTASSVLPFRNNGIRAANALTSIMNLPAPILTPPVIQEIREITVYNPGPEPVQVLIQFRNGNNLVISTLMNSMLPGENTLSYNATPGENGVWQRFDNAGFLVSSH